MGRLLFSLQFEAANGQTSPEETSSCRPSWLDDAQDQMFIIRTFIQMNLEMEVTAEGRRLYMALFEAERSYYLGYPVDEEEVRAAIEAANSLPQESIFRTRESAEQAEQNTPIGDTEPNSDDEDYWLMNSYTSSEEDGHSIAVK